MTDEQLLDEALSRSRVAAPRSLDAQRARQLARAALAAATAPRPRRAWPVAAAIGGLSVAAAAALVVLAHQSPAHVGSKTIVAPAVVPTEPIHRALPPGDRVAGDPVEVVSATEHRIVALHDGDALFDIDPRPGSFTVVAGAVSVQVLGTVFSVRRTGTDVAVRVFEGRVEVASDAALRILGAGDVWTVSGDPPDPEWLRRSDAQWARVAPTRAASPPVTSSPAPDLGLGDAQALVRGGQLAPALAAAERALARPDPEPEWRLLRADALAGLGRGLHAAEAYCDAAPYFIDGRRPQAAYAAAALYAEAGHPGDAATCLSSGGALAQGSPVEERARALQLTLLRELGREDALAAATEAYLRRFPGTTTARALRQEIERN